MLDQNAQNDLQGCALVRSWCGAALVYPGHPIAIACVIMSLYPTLAAAKAPHVDFADDETMAATLFDERIPGSASMVLNALQVLQDLKSTGNTPGAIEAAHQYWARVDESASKIELGAAQGEQLELMFKQLSATWL